MSTETDTPEAEGIDLSFLTEEERAAYLPDDVEDTAEEPDELEEEDEDEEDGEEDAADDEAEDEAEEDAGADEAPEAAQAQEEPEGEPDPAPEVQAAPRPVVEPKTFWTEEDAKARDETEAKLDALIDEFDNGDLTRAEFAEKQKALRKEMAALDQKEAKAEAEAENYKAALTERWFSEVDAWLAKHPEIPMKDESKADVVEAFDAVVKEVGAMKAAQGKPAAWILNRALLIFREENPGMLPKAKPAPKADAKPEPKKKRRSPPPNIGDLPSTDTMSADGGKFAALDRLADSDPLKYEAQLAKLSPEDADEYLSGRE